MAGKRRAYGPGNAAAAMSCPAGHSLPHRSTAGDCTPLACADARTAEPPEEKRPTTYQADRAVAKEVIAATAAEIDEIIPRDIDSHERIIERKGAQEGLMAEATVYSRALGRRMARQKFVKAPEGLEGDEADKWAKAKLVSLRPEAAVAYEEALKFGDRKERMEAAKMVLDDGRRDGNFAHVSPIVIQIADPASIRLPWAQPPIGSTATRVDTVITPGLPDGTQGR